MNRTIRYMTLVLAATLSSGAALAEKWVSLGDGFFMDPDSRLRQGNIGSVLIRHMNESQRMAFDCVNARWLPPDQGPQPIGSLAPIYDAACNRRLPVCD